MGVVFGLRDDTIKIPVTRVDFFFVNAGKNKFWLTKCFECDRFSVSKAEGDRFI
jgi:hypothetical protein